MTDTAYEASWAIRNAAIVAAQDAFEAAQTCRAFEAELAEKNRMFVIMHEDDSLALTDRGAYEALSYCPVDAQILFEQLKKVLGK